VSRSRRHTPITGITTSESEKWYKTHIHRRERVRVHTLLKIGRYEEAETQVIRYNAWDAPKDGRQYLNPRECWALSHGRITLEEWQEVVAKAMRK